MTAKELKIIQSDDLHTLCDSYRTLRELGNRTILGRGQILEEVYQKKLWMSQDYDTYAQCVSDPNGFDTRPRTARLYRLIYKVWAKKLAKLGITEDEAVKIDHVKLAYVAKAIMKSKDDNEILELVHKAKTNTLRELQDHTEEEEYYIFDGKAKVHKWLNDSSGYIIHLSQGKCKFYEESPSAQGWNNVFGQRLVEIKIRLKKDGEEDE